MMPFHYFAKSDDYTRSDALAYALSLRVRLRDTQGMRDQGQTLNFVISRF